MEAKERQEGRKHLRNLIFLAEPWQLYTWSVNQMVTGLNVVKILISTERITIAFFGRLAIV